MLFSSLKSISSRRLLEPAPLRMTALVMAMMFVSALNAAGRGQTISDQSISDAVEDELIFDVAVPHYRIDVNTQEGVVTLTGVVDNILAKDRAARLAETVKGVRAVVNRIGVKPLTERSDPTIRSDIRTALATDPATESYEVWPEVVDGVATLSGAVDSWQEKQLAVQVAKGVRGVTEVVDKIQIDYETDRPDVEIRNEIVRSLQWNTLVDDALIEVSVEDGHVVLSGTVGSAAEKSQAIVDAWTMGVKSVNAEKLEVARWARDADLRAGKYTAKTDPEVERAVEDALLYDPRVLSAKVEVEVRAGMATLRGAVSSLAAKRAAVQDARNTVGVLQVDDRLKVRLVADVDDGEIERDIEGALLRDPYVNRLDILVTVLNGVVYLSGDVDNLYEKARAEDIAENVPGVMWVYNNLDSRYLTATPGHDPYVDDYTVWDYDWYTYDTPRPLKSDDAILEDIESELWWSPFVDSDEVNVSVEDGVATLTGEVDSWDERNAATDNAYEGGATWVDNDLVVVPGS